MKIIDFAKIAFKDYRRVGAIVPSSLYVAQRSAKQIKGKKIIVEYGAGDGVISKEILKNMPKDGVLVAFETNKKLFNELKKIDDKRLKPINGDVRNISDYLHKLDISSVDAIISGIPFSLMKKKDRKEIINNARLILSKKGIMVIYQTSPLVFPILKRIFPKVRLCFEIKNVPPYFIMTAINTRE